MFRTQVYLTDAAHKKLAAFAKMRGKSQSELLREAVDSFLAANEKDRRTAIIKKCAGMWKDRTDAELAEFEETRRSADRDYLYK